MAKFLPGDRLRFEDVQPIPKRIFDTSAWTDHTGTLKAARNPHHSAHDQALSEVKCLVKLRAAIIAGSALPDGCYRKGKGLTADPLLANHGIMHLHLASSSSSALLYLIQYSQCVVFLELNDHKYAQYANQASSQNLLAVHRFWLKKFENGEFE